MGPLDRVSDQLAKSMGVRAKNTASASVVGYGECAKSRSLSVEKRRKRNVRSQHLSRPIVTATKTAFRL
jgi:hypothetical protein